MRGSNPFPYTLNIQWCPKREQYEAFSPSLVKISSDFKLNNRAISYGDSIETAVTLAMVQSNKVIEELGGLGILPPDPDVLMNYNAPLYDLLKENTHE